jgi:hypothetical protein
MPMEKMAHMFGGTKRKQSLSSEAINYYARDDESSPRLVVQNKFCPDQLSGFRNCMAANDYDENKCIESKGALDTCSKQAFRETNADPNFVF